MPPPRLATTSPRSGGPPPAEPPAPRRARGPAPAFTLIELLITLAIIALLSALLLPALGGARSSARAALCASNLRALHAAIELYASDARDRYAPGAPDMLANRTRWHGSRPSAAAPFSAAGGTLTPYLTDADSASPAIRSCPEFVHVQLALAESRIGFERSAGGYGYNNAFVGVDRTRSLSPAAPDVELWSITTDRLGSPRSRFQSTSATVAFADSALADGNTGPGTLGLIEYSFAEPRFWPDNPSPGARPDPTIHFRHGARRASTCWLDGHISAERRTHSASSGFYPADPAAHDIGWFGSTDDNALFDYR